MSTLRLKVEIEVTIDGYNDEVRVIEAIENLVKSVPLQIAGGYTIYDWAGNIWSTNIDK